MRVNRIGAGAKWSVAAGARCFFRLLPGLLLLLSVACGKKGEDPWAKKDERLIPPDSLGAAPKGSVQKPITSEDALTTLVKDAETRADSLDVFARVDDRSVIPAILEIMRFSQLGRAPALQPREIEVLRNLSGKSIPIGDWESWMEWWWREKAADPHAGYPFLKRYFFAQLNVQFMNVLDARAPSSVDRTEIIPRPDILQKNPIPLNDPKSAGNRSIETRSLVNKDLVVGIEVDGEHRAYPLKLLVHHEIVNDTLGGKQVVVSYNPWSRSVFAYLTEIPGEEPLRFGYTGLFYRGDTVLVDGTKNSLWASRSGEPILGAFQKGDQSPKLTPLPVTISTWYVWRKTYWDTSVLSVETGHMINYEAPDPYAGFHAAPETGIPMINRDERLPMKEVVFGIYLNGEAVVYPYSLIEKTDIFYDVVGGERITVFCFPYRNEFRAYKSGDHHLAATTSPYHFAEAQLGSFYEIGEHSATYGMKGASRLSFERVPGDVTLWYAWQLWYPNTRIYTLEDANNAATFYPGVTIEAGAIADASEFVGPPAPSEVQKQ